MNEKQTMMGKTKTIQNHIDSFTNLATRIWENRKPLCLLFSTERGQYLYDTGTNNIFKCTNSEFKLFKNLLSFDYRTAVEKFVASNSQKDVMRTIVTVKNKIINMKILNITEIENFSLSHDHASVIHKINNELGLMQLELTESCNLRCKYCVYNEFYKAKRNHRNYYMSEEIAKKSIEYLRNHSREKDSVAISFYGGEPLLNFKLMEKVVNYSKEIFKDKKLGFAVTTNASLVNKKIAKFLSKENFSILISLDGPKFIHDAWRRDVSNKGSYDRTYLGFKTLWEAFNKTELKLGLSMVYAPPYSERRIENIAEYVSSLDGLQHNSPINITYPSDGTISPEFQIQDNDTTGGFDFSLSNWARNRFFKDYKANKESHPIAKAILENNLARVLQRPIIDTPVAFAHLNGCCVPGARKVFITASGEIEVCERIGDAPSIGNVTSGIDKNRLLDVFVDEYSEKSISDCSRCWLARLCPLCYQQAFSHNRIDVKKKRLNCQMQKMSSLQYLIDFCSLLEINDKGLDYLYDWEFI